MKIGTVVKFSEWHLSQLDEDDELIESERQSTLMVVGRDSDGIVCRYMYFEHTRVRFGAWHTGLNDDDLEELNIPDDELMERLMKNV